MTTTVRRVRQWLVVVVMIGSIAAPPKAMAQDASTCGWDYLEQHERPPTITRLLDRGPVSVDVRATARSLDAWFTGCDATAARVAVQSLRRQLSRTNSSDPQLRGLLGIALLRGPEVQVERAEGMTLRSVLEDTNAATEGVRLLSEVAQATGWSEVAEELALVTVALRKPSHLRTVEAVLRGAAFEGNGRIAALRAEVLLALGAADSAIVAVDGNDHPLARRVSAVAKILMGESSSQYFDALSEASTSDIQSFYDDLRLLLNPAETAEWQILESGRRSAWIIQKWKWRAMLAGVSVEQRITEHHRRMQTALNRYQRRGFRGAPPTNAAWLNEPRITRQPLDDRGLILVRHGEPTTEIHARGYSPLAWHYGGTGPGPGVFEFARANDRSDYMLIEPTPACKQGHVLTERNARGVTTVRDHIDWALQLMPYDKPRAMYYEACGRGSFVAAGRYLGERTEARREHGTIISTETAVPRFAHPLMGTVNLYGFRHRSGGELIAYLGVAADSLTPDIQSGSYEYRMQVRLAAGDPSSERVTQRDTVIRFVLPAALPKEAVIGATVSLNLETGSTSHAVLTVTNQHNSAQGQVLSGIRRIPGTGGTVLSDLVIAYARPGVWLRRGHALAPILGHVVTTGANFQLYYEVYGVEPDDPLQVEIQVTPGREESVVGALRSWLNRRTALVIEFQESADADAEGVVAVSRTIGAELEPGTYVLHVKVTNMRTSATATVDTRLVIAEAER